MQINYSLSPHNLAASERIFVNFLRYGPVKWYGPPNN